MRRSYGVLKIGKGCKRGGKKEAKHVRGRREREKVKEM